MDSRDYLAGEQRCRSQGGRTRARYLDELGVNQSATPTVIVAPGMNPGGQQEFASEGSTVTNPGPRVRVYGDSYSDEDFMYAVQLTNTLTINVAAGSTTHGKPPKGK